MEIGLLDKDELVETLAREFYSIQGYEIPPDYRMQSSTNQVEKSCVAMALFAIQKFQSLHCVVEEESTNKLTDTQKVTDWFSEFWNYGRQEEIKSRVLSAISDYRFTDDEADQLGRWIWDDFTSFESITKDFPLPEIDDNLVDWKSVGVYIHDLFGVRFYEDDEDEDDNYETDRII